MKRRIVTMLLGVVLLSLIVIYFKEENKKISYGLNDNPIAVMIYDEAQDTYVKKSNVPIGNYRLNEDKSYCTNGGEINHYNWATGTIQYTLDIGEKCYLYFYEETTPSYAIYSETDNSLIFYKNNDTVGSTYNGRVVTAKYDDIENSVYTYDTNTETPNTPWYEYANVIKTVSVANEITPISTANWFYYLQQAESINLANLDTSQVTTMYRMFDRAGYNSSTYKLNLGNDFDTRNVTDMERMFQGNGNSANQFVLDLGPKFDTSNVETMHKMFNYIGMNASVIDLKLGTKFDTSKVVDMTAMFQRFGEKADTLVLDLGDKFDVSNVTTMAGMFSNFGVLSQVVKIDLGDKFDTSKVTYMYAMFSQTGQNSTIFELDLGEKFNTSNVINMDSMFQGTGSANLNFVLDVSCFVIQPTCDLTDFVANSTSKIIFGEGWANATLVSGMFLCDNSTPIEIVNAPANIQNYNFASDNRVPTFTTI